MSTFPDTLSGSDAIEILSEIRYYGEESVLVHIKNQGIDSQLRHSVSRHENLYFFFLEIIFLLCILYTRLNKALAESVFPVVFTRCSPFIASRKRENAERKWNFPTHSWKWKFSFSFTLAIWTSILVCVQCQRLKQPPIEKYKTWWKSLPFKFCKGKSELFYQRKVLRKVSRTLQSSAFLWIFTIECKKSFFKIREKIKW